MGSSATRRQFLACATAFPYALQALASPVSEAHERPESSAALRGASPIGLSPIGLSRIGASRISQPASPISPGNSESSRWVLLGTGTDKGIFRAAWNPERGELSRLELAAPAVQPTFLALHPRLPLLYAVNEVPVGDGGVTSFWLDRERAALTPLAQVSSGGNAPCYISVDATGQNAPGRHAERQDAAHMHCATVSPDNRFVLACNLGEDAIEIFRMHPGAASPIEAPVRVATRSGSGPRHLAFHPNGLWLYCIHELDCTIDLYDWNVSNELPAPVLRQNSVVSTLGPGDPNAEIGSHSGSIACEIAASPDGRFVYANTRGENSLVVYRVNASTGLLTEQQRVFSGGGWTRHFAFDPSRTWLLCANQGTSTVTVFEHDPATGHLQEPPRAFAIDTPMFIQFV